MAAALVDWEAEEARLKAWAMKEIAKRDPESEEQLDRWDNVKYLRLANLNEIPPRTFDLLQLTRLDIKGDSREDSPLRLTAIPSAIGQLSNLVALDLNQHAISTLPNSISQLTNLTHLQLDNNRFAQLPEELGTLSQLKVCSMSREFN